MITDTFYDIDTDYLETIQHPHFQIKYICVFINNDKFNTRRPFDFEFYVDFMLDETFPFIDKKQFEYSNKEVYIGNFPLGRSNPNTIAKKIINGINKPYFIPHLKQLLMADLERILPSAQKKWYTNNGL